MKRITKMKFHDAKGNQEPGADPFDTDEVILSYHTEDVEEVFTASGFIKPMFSGIVTEVSSFYDGSYDLTKVPEEAKTNLLALLNNGVITIKEACEHIDEERWKTWQKNQKKTR